MEKLTIQHIAPYLPYGLKILRPDGKTILPVIGVKHGNYIFHEIGSPYETFGDVESELNKPILYPISCLTKTIQHEGREFIPIVELCKIQTSLNLIDCTFEFGEDDLPLLPDIWVNAINEHGRVIACLIFNADNVCFRDGMDNPQSFNQYQLFQKLAEWHINFNGIPEGQYIDKETLK